MKKTLIIIVLFFSFNSFGQKDNSPVEIKNEVGFVFSDLLNDAVQLKYERLVGKQLTVGLGFGYKGEEGLIRLSGLDTEHVKTSDLTYSGIKIIPEVRYYLKKSMLNTMDGLYVGAYVKYSNYKSDLDGSYINDAGESFVLEYDAKLNQTSVGFMVGYKVKVYNRISLDFLIAGPGVGFHSYSLTKQQALPEEFYDDLNDALNNYPLFDFIESNFEFKENNTKTNFSGIAFRYAMSIGYSF